MRHYIQCCIRIQLGTVALAISSRGLCYIRLTMVYVNLAPKIMPLSVRAKGVSLSTA